jgi:hypothetical protein
MFVFFEEYAICGRVRAFKNKFSGSVRAKCSYSSRTTQYMEEVGRSKINLAGGGRVQCAYSSKNTYSTAALPPLYRRLVELKTSGSRELRSFRPNSTALPLYRPLSPDGLAANPIGSCRAMAPKASSKTISNWKMDGRAVELVYFELKLRSSRELRTFCSTTALVERR